MTERADFLIAQLKVSSKFGDDPDYYELLDEHPELEGRKRSVKETLYWKLDEAMRRQKPELQMILSGIKQKQLERQRILNGIPNGAPFATKHWDWLVLQRKNIGAAYGALSDPAKRSHYDQDMKTTDKAWGKKVEEMLLYAAGPKGNEVDQDIRDYLYREAPTYNLNDKDVDRIIEKAKTEGKVRESSGGPPPGTGTARKPAPVPVKRPTRWWVGGASVTALVVTVLWRVLGTSGVNPKIRSMIEVTLKDGRGVVGLVVSNENQVLELEDASRARHSFGHQQIAQWKEWSGTEDARLREFAAGTRVTVRAMGRDPILGSITANGNGLLVVRDFAGREHRFLYKDITAIHRQ